MTNYHRKLVETAMSWKGKHVLVVGDAMLDVRLDIAGRERSYETSNGCIHRVAQHGTQIFPGGAANAAANVASLGGQSHFLFVTGMDEASALLRKAVGEALERWYAPESSHPVPVKIRIGEDRYDFFDDPPRHDEHTATLLSHAIMTFRPLDAILISDYGKGTLHPDVIHAIGVVARRSECPVVLDPKQATYPELADVITAITPNYMEYMGMGGFQTLRRIYPRAQIVVTRGQHGCDVVADVNLASHFPAAAVLAKDVCGAGDSFVAALTLALAAGIPVHDATYLANAAGAAAVQRHGTTCVTPEWLAAEVASVRAAGMVV